MIGLLDRAGAPEFDFSEAMLEAGERALLSVLGGTELPGDFSAVELAKQVYRDMEIARQTGRVPYWW